MRVAAPYLLPGAVLAWAVGAVWGSELVAVKVAIVAVVAAVLTRPWPLTGLVLAFAGLFAGADLARPSAEDQHLALLVLACFRVGQLAPLRRQPWAGTAVLLLLSSNLLQPDRDVAAADVVFPVLLTAGPWLLGLTVQLAVRRERQAVELVGDLERIQDEEVRRATSEERLRIAQELHDVVAHAISGLSLQAQLARRRAEAGRPPDVEQLCAIEQGAQQAMNDLRRLLGVMRPDDPAGPLQPESLADLDALLDRERRLGHQVRLTTTGEPRPLPPALSSSAYRIVQEALTNARRHGTGGTALHLDWADGSLGICVRNRAHTTDEPVPGHGLVGIRERAGLFGGHVEAGRDGETWSLLVRLPAPLPVGEPGP